VNGARMADLQGFYGSCHGSIERGVLGVAEGSGAGVVRKGTSRAFWGGGGSSRPHHCNVAIGCVGRVDCIMFPTIMMGTNHAVVRTVAVYGALHAVVRACRGPGRNCRWG